jgi:hypothetical protein
VRHGDIIIEGISLTISAGMVAGIGAGMVEGADMVTGASMVTSAGADMAAGIGT